MTPSPWLFGVLKARTPFRPTAWREHRKDRWTIGYGFTGALAGAEVLAGATVTMEEAETLLCLDIEAAVTSVMLHTPTHNQGYFDVLVALAVAGQ